VVALAVAPDETVSKPGALTVVLNAVPPETRFPCRQADGGENSPPAGKHGERTSAADRRGRRDATRTLKRPLLIVVVPRYRLQHRFVSAIADYGGIRGAPDNTAE